MKNSDKKLKNTAMQQNFFLSTIYVEEAINETALIQGCIQKLLQKD